MGQWLISSYDGDSQKLDGPGFAKKTRKELVPKIEPIYTKEMADRGELPPVGSEAVLFVGEFSETHACVKERSGEVFDIVAHHGSAKGLAVAVSRDCLVSVTANHAWFKPIDTRTPEEKAEQALKFELMTELELTDKEDESYINNIVDIVKNAGFKWSPNDEK